MSSMSYASALYSSAHCAGRVRQAWAKLRGQSCRLLDLTTVAATCTIGDRRAAGMQTVSIRQIRGSEGRCDDFDVAFRPLKQHTEARWLNVARAYLRGIGLPAVELIQLGDVYFVRDGHHRISVAAALGQMEVDAVVTIWQVAEPVLQELSRRALPPSHVAGFPVEVGLAALNQAAAAGLADRRGAGLEPVMAVLGALAAPDRDLQPRSARTIKRIFVR